MPDSSSWHRLRLFERLTEARVIATSASSMGFEVRLVDVRTGRIDEGDDEAHEHGQDEPRPDDGGPWALEAPEEDRDELAPAIEAIIEEQSEFDARLAVRDGSSLRARRVFLGVMIALVAILAMLGIIRL